MVAICFLQSLYDASIKINAMENSPIYLGRTPECGVVNPKCSRKQVMFTAKPKSKTGIVEKVGTTKCALNGIPLNIGEEKVVNDGDTILVFECKNETYAFKVHFDPPEGNGNSGTSTSASSSSTSSGIASSISASSVSASSGSASSSSASSISASSGSTPSGSASSISASSGSTPSVSASSGSASSVSASSVSASSGSASSGSASSGSALKSVTLDHFLKSNVAPTFGTWKEYDNGFLLLFTSNDCEPKHKIAAYDLDGTIIGTKSGLVFPKDTDDWKLAFNSDVKLREIRDQGYKIVIFTNQAGIKRGKIIASQFKRKIENILRRLSVPCQVFVSTGRDKYRKPLLGMLNRLLNNENGDVKVNLEESFFCGDAAGRAEKRDAKKKKKDHSSSDRLFAYNAKLNFFTPEEHFLGQKAEPFELPKFIPADIFSANIPLYVPEESTLILKQIEVVLMVGCPASGKSFFAKKYLVSAGYIYVNRDTLGTAAKCLQKAEDAIVAGRPVIVDNTNPDVESRARFIQLAQKHGVPARAFIMNTTREHAEHNNVFRTLTDEKHIPINSMIIQSYFSKYQKPTLEEGISEILQINFVPSFDDEEKKNLYSMYLLEN